MAQLQKEAIPLLLRCKAIVIGDAAVGKSAIVQMFHSKGTHYPKQYAMTTGCDFVMKEIKIPDTTTTVELHIYDCSGQVVFKELVCEYWKNANMVMLVYDVSNQDSFSNLGPWLDLLRKKCPEKVLPGVLVANKIDLEDRIRVQADEGSEFARAHNLKFVQVSAHKNTCVENPFQEIAKAFADLYEEKLDLLNSI
jgi:intraflagellar transport protein 27